MSAFFDMAKYLNNTRKSALQAFTEGNYGQFIDSIERLKECFDDPRADKAAVNYFKEVMIQAQPNLSNILPEPVSKEVLRQISFSEEAFNTLSKRYQTVLDYQL